MSRTVKTRKFELLYFRNKTCYGTGNLYKDLFLVYLQPSVNKNSKNLAILSLKFDDVTVKTIYTSLCWHERVWWTKSQSILLNIYFRLSGFQSSLLIVYFRWPTVPLRIWRTKTMLLYSDVSKKSPSTALWTEESIVQYFIHTWTINLFLFANLCVATFHLYFLIFSWRASSYQRSNIW